MVHATLSVRVFLNDAPVVDTPLSWSILKRFVRVVLGGSASAAAAAAATGARGAVRWRPGRVDGETGEARVEVEAEREADVSRLAAAWALAREYEGKSCRVVVRRVVVAAAAAATGTAADETKGGKRAKLTNATSENADDGFIAMG